MKNRISYLQFHINYNYEDFIAGQVIEGNDIDTKKVLNGQTLNISLDNGLYKLNNGVDTVAIVKIEDFKAKMLVFLG